MLSFLAVVGGVGLAGDDEDFADADVLDRGVSESSTLAGNAGFQAIPSPGRSSQSGTNFPLIAGEGGEFLPSLAGGEAGFKGIAGFDVWRETGFDHKVSSV